MPGSPLSHVPKRTTQTQRTSSCDEVLESAQVSSQENPVPVSQSPAIVRDLIIALEQGHDLVAALSDDTYRHAPTVIKASSIGAHYRHHLEHVQLLIKGFGSEIVDYDCRERDARIEQDRDVALARTKELIEALSTLTEQDLDGSLTIAHRTCVEDQGRCAPSTLRRELLFLLSHAIHHYALIKIIAESLGSKVPQQFGVMPSTLVHLNS